METVTLHPDMACPGRALHKPQHRQPTPCNVLGGNYATTAPRICRMLLVGAISTSWLRSSSLAAASASAWLLRRVSRTALSLQPNHELDDSGCIGPGLKFPSSLKTNQTLIFGSTAAMLGADMHGCLPKMVADIKYDPHGRGL